MVLLRSNAVGPEQNVTRFYNFIKKRGSDFQGAPLELLFDQVEDHVNTVVGKDTTTTIDSKFRTISKYTYATVHKYTLIMEIVETLSGEVKIIREHITQTVSDMFADMSTLVGIQDFQKTLNITFKENGQLSIFKNTVVKGSSKNVSSNKAGITKGDEKDDPAKVKEWKDTFNKNRITNAAETEFKKGVIALVNKIKNESNKNSDLADLKEYKDYCSQQKKTGCWHCISVNCRLGQNLSKKLSLKTRFAPKCPKKKITLAGVGAPAANDKASPTTTGATASVGNPSVKTEDYSSDEEELQSVLGRMNHNSTDGQAVYGFVGMGEVSIQAPT